MERNPNQGGEHSDFHIPTSWAERRPEQRFFLGAWAFNIDRARNLIIERPRETQRLPVTMWAEAYGLAPLPGKHSMSLIGPGPNFDRDYAMTTDVTEPVIVATLHSRGIGEAPLLIDGTHRLYRAYQAGLPHLPAFVLDVEESLAIRDDLQ
jgi:hypothetical protein